MYRNWPGWLARPAFGMVLMAVFPPEDQQLNCANQGRCCNSSCQDERQINLRPQQAQAPNYQT